MKYGVLFSAVTLMLFALAIVQGGWYRVLIWPAISFAIVAGGYIHFGPMVFGKGLDGRIGWFHRLLLLPVLVGQEVAYHLVRSFRKEDAWNEISPQCLIGRRLLSGELPESVDNVIDLTSEFTEPRALRERTYHSFQILDGSVPTGEQLQEWARQANQLDGTSYIHCAAGHGRTGLLAVAMLIEAGTCKTVDSALEFLKRHRRLLKLSRAQRRLLDQVYGTSANVQQHGVVQ